MFIGRIILNFNSLRYGKCDVKCPRVRKRENIYHWPAVFRIKSYNFGLDIVSNDESLLLFIIISKFLENALKEGNIANCAMR